MGVFLFTAVQSQTEPRPLPSPLNPPEIRPFRTLTLELATLSDRVLPMQPIPLRLRQSNKTTFPAFGYSTLSIDNPIYFYVRRHGADRRTLVGQRTALLKMIGFKNGAIAPGITIEAREWLTLNLRKYFPNPGVYEIQAVLGNDDGTQSLESNAIDVEVTEPTGNDLLAHKMIRNSGFEDFLFSGAEFEQVESTLLQLSTLYPNTRYGLSASFVLGEVYYFRKDYVRALAHLIRLEGLQDFVYFDKVGRYLSEIRRAATAQTGTE